MHAAGYCSDPGEMRTAWTRVAQRGGREVERRETDITSDGWVCGGWQLPGSQLGQVNGLCGPPPS